MDLLVVAQLITGVATLVVALVLIWQMFLQRKTLEIAHKDADLTMSFLSVNTKSIQKNWWWENSSNDLINRMDKGIKYLDEKEIRLLQNHIDNMNLILHAEYRLGKFNRSPYFFKRQFRQNLMLDLKASRDLINNLLDPTNPIVETGYSEMIKEVIEEIEDKKKKLDKKL